MKRIISLLICLIMPVTSYAGLGGEMDKFFNSMGLTTNTTGSGVYKGQEGILAFGGGTYMRSPNQDLQLGWYQPPHLSSDGCNIDMHFGGFGFVNSKKIVEMARNIGASATAYMFSLALKQMSPQIANQIESVQSMANRFNQFNINSCEMGKYAVDKGLDLVKSASNSFCQSRAMDASSNDAGGPAEARRRCGNRDYVNQMNKEASEDPKAKDAVLLDKNLAWEAIQNNPTLKALDKDTKYLLMSLAGTMVITSTTPNKYGGGTINAPNVMFYESKILSDTENILNSLKNLGGGAKVKLYACADPDRGCLKVITKDINLDSTKSFHAHVRNLVKGIEAKVAKDGELSPAEKNFIGKTDLQIYKLIKMQRAFTRNIELSFIDEYIDMIATEMLLQYLEKCIGNVTRAYANNLLPEKYSSKFFTMATRAKNKVDSIKLETSSRSQLRQEMAMKVKSMQKILSSNISAEVFSQIANVNGKGV